MQTRNGDKAARVQRRDGVDASWREDLLTRLGRILFLAGTPMLVLFLLWFDLSWPRALAAALLPLSGALTMVLAGRVGPRWRASLSVVALLLAGATVVNQSGPAPAAVLALALASVVAALVFDGRGALVVLLAAAVCLALGGLNRAETALLWAEQLPLVATWARLASVFAVLGGLMVLLVNTAVRRGEANAAELQRAEGRARASEERLRLALDAARIGAWQWDIDSGEVTWSGPVEPLLGLPPGSFAGTRQAFVETVHPDDRPAVERAIEDALTDVDQEYRVEFRVRSEPDRWLSSQGSVSRAPDGRPLSLRGTIADVSARRRADAALRHKEELFRAVVEDQTEMIVRWKPDGTRTFVNQAYCRFFGISAEDAVGTSFLPLVAEQDREAVWAKMRALTPQNPVSTEPHESVTVTGETRWQEWTDRGLFDARGRLVELQSTGRDVTEQRAARAALESSEQRYRLLFEGNPLPMLVYAVDTLGFVAGNAAAVAQYGFSREELLNMSVGDLMAPGDPHYPDFLAEVGKVQPSVVHLGLRQQRRRDGTVIDVDMTSLEVPFAGRIARLILCRDVTAERQAAAERARLQVAVEQAAAEWQRTFDAVEPALVVFDAEGRVVRLNRAAIELIQDDEAKVLGRPLDGLGDREPWGAARRVLDQLVRTRAAASLEAHDPANGQTWMLTASVAEAGTGGDERRILVIANITRLVQLQESLRRSETMAALGSVVAGVAHEIRNPLFSITATLDALEAEYGAEQGYSELSGLLRSQVARLVQLTRDLFDYGKPSRVSLAQAQMGSLIRHAVDGCARHARARGVGVETDVADTLPMLRVDPGRIQQVIENLVVNAIQHSPAGGTVVVRAEAGADAKTVCVVVEDQGPGISADDAPRLFEPFFSRREGGTGLGLSIVRRIVESHDGRVTAESGANGARFRVTLPVGGPAAAEPEG